MAPPTPTPRLTRRALRQGRLFNHKLFDMYEFGLERYVGLEDIPGEKCFYNTKPCMVFQGDTFENDPTHRAVKELFLGARARRRRRGASVRAADPSRRSAPDFFRGEEVSDVALASLDHAIVVSAVEDRILVRAYTIAFRKSGTRVRGYARPCLPTAAARSRPHRATRLRPPPGSCPASSWT